MSDVVSAESLTFEQRAQEQSIWLGIVLDAGIIVALISIAVIGGSLTLMAESIRTTLGLLLEFFTYGVLRRVHRGVLADVDYGTGKLEQVANLVIGTGMLLGTVWIVIGAFQTVVGERELATPIGLALAAIVASLNLYINVIVWDRLRRVAEAGDSPLVKGQLIVRWTKLIASLVVVVGLTVAALSTDDVVVAWADALGSVFVAIYMVFNAREVLRVAIPDLLDRSAGAEIKTAVAGALEQHASLYTRLRRVRTRRSGRTAFIEIALEFDPGLTIDEVDRRVETLKTKMREAAGEADIAVQAFAAARQG